MSSTTVFCDVYILHLYGQVTRSECSNEDVPEARFPSKRNRLRFVRCVWMETGLNANACVGKQPIMVGLVATASTEHPIGCCLQPIGCSVEAVATMIGCFPTQAFAFSPVSIQTQRTQRTQRTQINHMHSDTFAEAEKNVLRLSLPEFLAVGLLCLWLWMVCTSRPHCTKFNKLILRKL